MNLWWGGGGFFIRQVTLLLVEWGRGEGCLPLNRWDDQRDKPVQYLDPDSNKFHQFPKRHLVFAIYRL